MTLRDNTNKKPRPPTEHDVLTTPARRGRLDMSLVYRELKTSLTRFAYRYYKKPQDVEDVVQEAFVKVYEAQSQRDIQHPKAYMYQTVRNLALRQLDKSDYKLTDTLGELQPETLLEDTPTMEEQFESKQKFELFCRAVSQLPDKCRHVYVLRRVYGFSHNEIAEQMGIGVKTIEAHLTKAIVRCSDYMEAEELRETGAMESASKKSKANEGHSL
jgi:RNA polymerase sigma factor (sigma-70 family)